MFDAPVSLLVSIHAVHFNYFIHIMQADILVSELLGSFGDNELSPECLDGAMSFVKRASV